MEEVEDEEHADQSLQVGEVPLMWEDLLRGRTVDLIKATCCAAVPEPSLRTRMTDDRSPKLIPWQCWNRKDKKIDEVTGSRTVVPLCKKIDEVTGFPTGVPLCKECGIETNLQIMSCPALVECDDVKIELKEWRLGPRSLNSDGTVDRTQIELLDSEPTPVKEVVTKFRRQLELCRTHYGQSRWMDRIRTIDTESIADDTILMFTDFSATDNLRAAQTDNSSEDSHMTIAVFCVLHSSRQVEVDGTVKWINDNDVWYFVGPTISKGKKNDHVFHNASVDHLIRHYKRVFNDEFDRVNHIGHRRASQWHFSLFRLHYLPFFSCFLPLLLQTAPASAPSTYFQNLSSYLWILLLQRRVPCIFLGPLAYNLHSS